MPQEHNRAKKYILNEGEFSPVLCELGVQTKDGHIAAPMYDKFRQINRFLEFIDDIASKDDAEEFKIIDFGCGKSYLTFLVYEYFMKRGR
ncbi:MAG: methyltransferase, partial [Clostridia bacterium]|nr:methyltransferase [Clostridia bacterium]